MTSRQLEVWPISADTFNQNMLVAWREYRAMLKAEGRIVPERTLTLTDMDGPEADGDAKAREIDGDMGAFCCDYFDLNGPEGG